MTYKVVLLNPCFNILTIREFPTKERAEQWAKQCGVYDPFKCEIVGPSGEIVYGFVSHEYDGSHHYIKSE